VRYISITTSLYRTHSIWCYSWDASFYYTLETQ